MIKSISLAENLTLRLRKYQIALTVGLPVLIALLIAISAARSLAGTDLAFLKALSPHLAVLIETDDRAEIQRFISAVSLESGKLMDVYWNGELIASTRDRSLIGLRANLNDKDWSLAADQLISRSPIQRPGGAKLDAMVALSSSIVPLVQSALSAFFIVLLIFAGITWFIGRKIFAVTDASLKPVTALANAIRKLARHEALDIQPSSIAEIETIRSSIASTRIELQQTTEALSEAKAKEMAGESFRLLIHDLATPVTALREMSKIVNDMKYPEDVRLEAQAQLPELAEQVLNQVGAGRQNLSLTVRMKRDLNLVESIRKTIERARLATNSEHRCEVVLNLPDTPISIPHDPEMLERVVSNLIKNAAEANSKRIEVRLKLFDGKVILSVADDGPGMAQETVALHLVGRGRSSKADRASLGLAGCNHIVKAHGGRLVHRRSSLGGSEFEIRLAETGGIL
jgi:signal transduction histidine kinase